MTRARVRQAFSQAAATYGQAATVQKQVVDALADFLGRYSRPDAWSPARILDVGSGTGFARAPLARRFPHADHLALDFSEAMLRRADGARVCADAEALPLADACVDLVWSSLTWQWCALPKVLAEARRVLRDDGVLAFATLTDGTFHELRRAFAALDAHAHTEPMLPAAAVLDAVRTAGFGDIETHAERRIAHYPTLKTLLTAIRETGANEVSGARRPGLLGRRGWAKVESAYAGQAAADGLPLTYDVLCVVARK